MLYYVCVYVVICIYICSTYVYVYICIHTYIYIYIYAYIHIYTYIYTYIFMYIYIYVWKYTHAYKYIYIFTFVCTYENVMYIHILDTPQQSCDAYKCVTWYWMQMYISVYYYYLSYNAHNCVICKSYIYIHDTCVFIYTRVFIHVCTCVWMYTHVYIYIFKYHLVWERKDCALMQILSLWWNTGLFWWNVGLFWWNPELLSWIIGLC